MFNIRSLVIYGPQGCGKTRNADILLKRLKMVRIVDEWDGFTELSPGSLALTKCEPPFNYPAISYDKAMGLNSTKK